MLRFLARWVAAAVLLGSLGDVPFLSAQSKTNMVFSENFLLAINRRHGLYFTLEVPDSATAPMVRNVDDSELATESDSMAALKRVYGEIGYTVFPSKDQAKLIHIVGTKALDDPTYPLNRELPSVSYRGTPDGLLDWLHQSVPEIGQPTAFGGAVFVMDFTTPIALEAQRITVREALSAGLSLQGYNAIVWTAATRLREDKRHWVEITFQGPDSIRYRPEPASGRKRNAP